MRHVNNIVAAAVGAIALAGCGGSSGTSSSAPRHAQFVAQINRICSDVNAKVVALPAIHSTADLLSTGAKELTVSSAALTQLATLTRPAGNNAAIAKYVSDVRREDTLSAQLLTAVKSGDAKQIKSVDVRGTSLNAAANAEANGLGLAQCARDVQPAG